MKKTIRTAIVAFCAALALCGCSKSKNSLPGSYTYKISGSLTLEGDSVVSLFPEQGQMHIIDCGDGKAVVTFNDITGDAVVASATMDGNELTFDNAQKKSISTSDGTLKTGSTVVEWTGSGKLLDDMFIAGLKYSGEAKSGLETKAITECSIQCVAQKN